MSKLRKVEFKFNDKVCEISWRRNGRRLDVWLVLDGWKFKGKLDFMGKDEVK